MRISKSRSPATRTRSQSARAITAIAKVEAGPARKKRARSTSNSNQRLAAEVAQVGTPPRASKSPKKSASPKRKGRPNSPAGNRVTFHEEPELQPFRPQPLTPLGWDAAAEQAAGTQHPIKTVITPGCQEIDPAVISVGNGGGKGRSGRRAWRGVLTKKEGADNQAAQAKGKAAKGKGKGGKGKAAKSKGKGKAAKAGDARQVTTPGKDAKGAGKAQKKK